MYSDYDYIKLESMRDNELREEIKNAMEEIIGYQERFNELEKEMRKVSPLLKPDQEILFRGIKSCERYIRRAENLLEEWDDYRFLVKKRANRLKNTNVIRIKKCKLLI